LTDKKPTYRLLRKVLLLLVILVGLNEGACQYFYNIALADDELFAQDTAFEAAPDTIEFLFMGHSRPLSAIDPSEFPRSFNYSSDGEYNSYTYYKLKHILENTDKAIGTIILPAGYGSFQTMNDAYTYRSYYWSNYVDYLEVGQLKNDISTHTSIWFENLVFPYARHVGGYIDEQYGEPINAPETAPFSKMDAFYKEQNAIFMLAKNEDRKEVNSDVSLEYLTMTLALCRKHKKAIYFVKYPLTDVYDHALASYLERNPIDENISDSIIQNASGPFLLFDFSDLFYREHELFKDAHHLNANGRYKFSRQLTEMLLN
jgi:hypothetical protein